MNPAAHLNASKMLKPHNHGTAAASHLIGNPLGIVHVVAEGLHIIYRHKSSRVLQIMSNPSDLSQNTFWKL